MTARKGISLVEVLVAIFIVGVGLLSLLVLFPLGFMEMSLAVQDDRTGHMKETASSVANIVWTDPDAVNNGEQTTWTLRHDPRVVAAMRTPDATGTLRPPIPPGQDWSGYPILVDPIGFNSYRNAPAWQLWLGGLPGSMRRETIRAFVDPTLDPRSLDPGLINPGYPTRQLRRWFTFLDDMTFGRDDPGIAVPVLPVDREPRYSWAYLCQRENVNSLVTKLTVIVFSGRTLEPPSNPSGETVFGELAPGTSATFDPLANTIDLTWAGDPPDIRVGRWLVDITYKAPNPLAPTLLLREGQRRAQFYRIVGVTSTSTNSATVEVQTPAGGGITIPNATDGGPTWNVGTIALLDGVIEVFDRGID